MQGFNRYTFAMVYSTGIHIVK